MEITIGARQVVAGMEEGLQALALGAVARLHVPPHLGYGGVGAGPVPAGAALIFEVEKGPEQKSSRRYASMICRTST